MRKAALFVFSFTHRFVDSSVPCFATRTNHHQTLTLPSHDPRAPGLGHRKMQALTSSLLALALVAMQTLMLLPGWSGQVEAITLHACEGNHISLRCPMPTTQVILIRSAVYGRRTDPTGTPGRCGDNLVIHRLCEEDVTKFMKFRCEGQPRCEVYVDVATFAIEICVDIRKYVEVTYDCVPTMTMDSIQQCYQTCESPALVAAPVNTFDSKHLWSKTQIPGPAAGNSVAPAGHASSASASSPPAAVPSPPRASYSHSSSSSSSSSSSNLLQSPSAKPASPSHHPGAQALPYGNLNRSIAASLSHGSGAARAASSSGPTHTINHLQSAALRAQLMNRMRRLLLSLRNRKLG